MNSGLKNQLTIKIKNGEVISPFLFVGGNTEILASDVNNLALDLLREFSIPKEFLYTLENDGEKIKINSVKSFFLASNTKPSYDFQIFLIEDVGRMTIAAANSCLKVLEEPGVGNIILLTNSSENQILETILSRVQVVKSSNGMISERDNFFFSLLDSHLNKNSPEIFAYFYNNKLEKDDYISFLENIIVYAKENMVFLDLLDELNEDLYGIKNNNLMAKYIVDKYLSRLKS